MAAVLSPHHLDLRVLAPLLQDLSQPPSFVTADPQASGVTASPPVSGDEHTNLGVLPDEVLLAVAAHLGARGLGNLAQVDRRLRAIAEDDMLWKELFDGRFDFRPSEPPNSWKLAYLDYATTPRWHPTQKHPDLIIKDCGLVATMPTTFSDLDTDNRTIRAMIDYKPGTGLHYFEVASLCPIDVGYHPYVGICSSEETVPVTQMQMWHSELCYAYGGNGTLYSSPTLECHLQWLGKYKYGDLVGVLIDYREEECGWLTFFLNKEAVSQRIRITGTWFPCVGMFHPRHAMRIEVRPQVPEQETAEA